MIGGESDRVWVIDTSSILEIKERVPRVARPGCLGGLRSLVESGHLVYPRQVVQELERGCGGEDDPDEWFLWAKRHQQLACRYATDYGRLATLLQRVHLVVDTEKTTGVDEADPYVIELAVGIMDGGAIRNRHHGRPQGQAEEDGARDRLRPMAHSGRPASPIPGAQRDLGALDDTEESEALARARQRGDLVRHRVET